MRDSTEHGRPRRSRRRSRRGRVERLLLVLGMPLLFALLALAVELIEYRPGHANFGEPSERHSRELSVPPLDESFPSLDAPDPAPYVPVAE